MTEAKGTSFNTKAHCAMAQQQCLLFKRMFSFWAFCCSIKDQRRIICQVRTSRVLHQCNSRNVTPPMGQINFIVSIFSFKCIAMQGCVFAPLFWGCHLLVTRKTILGLYYPILKFQNIIKTCKEDVQKVLNVFFKSVHTLSLNVPLFSVQQEKWI